RSPRHGASLWFVGHARPEGFCREALEPAGRAPQPFLRLSTPPGTAGGGEGQLSVPAGGACPDPAEGQRGGCCTGCGSGNRGAAAGPAALPRGPAGAGRLVPPLRVRLRQTARAAPWRRVATPRSVKQPDRGRQERPGNRGIGKRTGACKTGAPERYSPARVAPRPSGRTGHGKVDGSAGGSPVRRG